MRRSILTSLCAFLVLAGCKGAELEVGDGKAETSDDASVGSSDGGVGTGSQGGVVWTGYLENYRFPSGSDAVTMTITTATDGTVTGNVYFGALPLLAPPTDPDVGYPPPLNDGSVTPEPGGATLDNEHFAYTVLGGTLAEERLTFTIGSKELWAQWCAMQTSYADGTTITYHALPDGGANEAGITSTTDYACLPGNGWEQTLSGCALPASGQAVDCGQVILCFQGVCTCTATGCSVPVQSSGDISFDMQVAGSTATGSVAGLQSANQNTTVHFTTGDAGH